MSRTRVPRYFQIWPALERGGGQWRKMANNGEKWRIMAMANSAFSFVKFAIFRQFLILEFHI